MNDWLEYKAAFEQNDLMHYGVKGMKWHKHLKGLYDTAKYRLKYDVGIGLKNDIKHDTKVINTLAKDEIQKRQSGNTKDANWLNNLRHDTQRERSYNQGMYNSSLLGKGENIAKTILSKLSGLFKKKK